MRVYYGLDLLLSKLSKAQSNGKFREHNTTDIKDTCGIGGKFADMVVDTGGEFVTGKVDTGGKFTTGVVDTGGAP